MLEISLSNLFSFLKENGFSVSEQSETEQLYIVFEIDGGQFPFFIRLIHDKAFVQFVIFIPIKLESPQLFAMARLLHALNRSMDLPGFCLDEQNLVVFYRAMVPSYEGRIAEELILNYINSIKGAAQSFGQLIRAVNAGAVSIDKVLKELRSVKGAGPG